MADNVPRSNGRERFTNLSDDQQQPLLIPTSRQCALPNCNESIATVKPIYQHQLSLLRFVFPHVDICGAKQLNLSSEPEQNPLVSLCLCRHHRQMLLDYELNARKHVRDWNNQHMASNSEHPHQVSVNDLHYQSEYPRLPTNSASYGGPMTDPQLFHPSIATSNFIVRTGYGIVFAFIALCVLYALTNI